VKWYFKTLNWIELQCESLTDEQTIMKTVIIRWRTLTLFSGPCLKVKCKIKKISENSVKYCLYIWCITFSTESTEIDRSWVWTIKFLFSSHGPENNVRVRHLIITVFIIVCSSVRLSHCNSIQFNVLRENCTPFVSLSDLKTCYPLPCPLPQLPGLHMKIPHSTDYPVHS
jgi:hypothetical protein